MSADLAVLGLGQMGGRSAVRAAAQGHRVTGFDPSPEARDQAAKGGVEVMASAEEAAASAPILLVSVPHPEHVADLAAGALHHAAPGSVVADLSTIDPETARAAAEALAPSRVTYLDAPVLGRPDKCGSWTLVTGGPAEAVEQVTPLLTSCIASRVVRVGDVGAGSVVKVVNNLMFGAINTVTAEALALCRAAGVDPAIFVEAVSQSGAATVSNLFKEIAPRMVSGDEEPAFTLDLLAKDNRLAVELARATDTAAPVADVVNRVNRAALDRGLGPKDTGAVYGAWKDLTSETPG